MKNFWTYLSLLVGVLILISCDKNPKQEAHDSASRKTTRDYIRQIPGENDTIPEELAQKGEVLIAYSDCYTCHTREKRAKGPSFKDIAQRYPIQKPYIEMLAHRVIAGGSGSWGSPVMAAHPHLSHEKAKIMVTYILSLKDK